MTMNENGAYLFDVNIVAEAPIRTGLNALNDFN
jgi:hypothetical protein